VTSLFDSEELNCILADRLYVPEAYVTPEHLNEYVYDIETTCAYDFGPFQTVTGSIRTFSKVQIDGKLYYGFSRGDIEKLSRLFGDFNWINRTSAPRMTSPLKFKGQLHTWSSKKIGQQEAVDAWLKHRSGIIRAAPRFGKCCVGSTLVQVHNKGLLPIAKLFSEDHQDDEFVPREVELATKDGVQTTSFLYKQTVEQTVKIRTKRGFTIEATRNHPLFVKGVDGKFDWKKMEELVVGDTLALFAGANTFSKKESSYASLYAAYIRSNRKFSVRVVYRLLLLGEKTQREVLDSLLCEGELELDNEKILELLQIMLLNLGYISQVLRC
jgi:hypothetical protein